MPNLKKELKECLKTAKRIHLKCRCVNWMGGCKEELGCNYGEVLLLRRQLEKMIADQDKKV